MASFLDRLLGRPEPPKYAKAVTSTEPWSTGIPLSLYSQDPQDKAAAYLRAYKVGWFYKAGKKIADDIASLDWSVSEGDMEEGEAETTLGRPDLRAPFAALRPIDQFQRLLEAPVTDPDTGRVIVTGRQLLRKTQVRLDFAGAAAWWLEGATAGLPTAIYGISPTRLWPSYDNEGKLIGWVLDRDAPSGGTPFQADEILWFSTGNASDDEMWGTSVVEAVYSQVPLTDLTARHTANVLTTGGRLAGMLWPKNRALEQNEFDDAQRAWRNVTSSGDAAKRLLIFPEPMEYASGASSPAEIGIPDLAALNRDEIISAFPVGPEMLGVPMPGGLNASGESRSVLRRFYWEDTIHPRADLLEETIQTQLLARYEQIEGRTFDFELSEPNLDDAGTLLEKVGALKGLVSFGFDPKDSIGVVGLSHLKWTQPPEPTPVPGAPPSAPEGVTATVTESNGANASEQISVAKAVKASGSDRIGAFLTDQRDRVVQKLRDTLPSSKAARKADPGDWWDADAEDAALRETLRSLYVEVGRDGLQAVANRLNRIVPNKAVSNILADLLTYGGQRITQINETTREAIALQLAEGTRRGYSINQIIDGVATEGYPGVQKALLDNGIEAFDSYRAEMIARTETTLSLNRSSLRGYDEFGVREVQAIDGDQDEECAARNGATFSVDEALAITDHPNGTLDWVPVLTKSIDKPIPPQVINLTPTFNVALPATKSEPIEFRPDIHIEPAVVNVKTAPITIEVPEPIVNVTNDIPAPLVSITNEVQPGTSPDVYVTNEVQTPTIVNAVEVPSVYVTNEVRPTDITVEAPNVTVEPQISVNVPEPKPVSRTIERDDKGQITRIVES